MVRNNRTYLRRPDQALTVTIKGAPAVGKSSLAEIITRMVVADGCVIESSTDGSAAILTIRSQTTGELRKAYIDGLPEHQRDALEQHLVALGVSV